jgi:hypothetical protein
MTIKITDAGTLNQLRPTAVQAYLQRHGWTKQYAWGDKATIWGRGDDTELLLPNTAQVADYALRVNELLSTLSRIEARSQDEIYQEINDQIANAEAESDFVDDVLRIRALHPASSDGSIPLIDAVKLYQGTYDLLLSAAAVVERPRPYLPNRKPSEALEYIQNARVGQTERGSYVLVVHSPLGAATDHDMMEQSRPVPFNRRVLQTLADALTTLEHLTHRINPDHAGEELLEREVNGFIEQGGSADLCSAVEKLNESVQERNLEISFLWARRAGIPSPESIKVTVTPKMSQLTQRISQTIRRKLISEEKSLKGTVVRLVQGDGDYVASVSIEAIVDGRRKRVRLNLKNEDDHALVILAYDKKIQVECQGQLMPHGNYTLLEPYHSLKLVVD